MGPFAAYGYEGEVLLPVEVTPPAAIEGTEVTIRARASWLVCQEECTPGDAVLSLRLPVATESASDPRWAEAFARTRAALPGARAERP